MQQGQTTVYKRDQLSGPYCYLNKDVFIQHCQGRQPDFDMGQVLSGDSPRKSTGKSIYLASFNEISISLPILQQKFVQ